MLTVTDDARTLCGELLDSSKASEEEALRLVAGPQGLGFAKDSPKQADETFEKDGRVVLVVEPTIAEQLDGRTLDAKPGEQGNQFHLS